MGGNHRQRLARVALRVSVCSAGLLMLAAAAPQAGIQNPRNLAAAARGATITASSEVGRLQGKDHTAGAAIDGKIGPGYWCTAFDSKAPHWLEVNLGGRKRFDEVVLRAHELFILQSCRVEQWDGTAWAPLAEATSQPAAGDFSPTWQFSDAPAGIVRCRFPAVSSDRVRFYFEKDGAVRLYEVEVLEARDLETPDKAAGASVVLPRFDREAPLVHIAFGRREGALAPGWLAVAAETRYSPEQGIGWLGDGQPSRLRPRRRGAVRERVCRRLG